MICRNFSKSGALEGAAPTQNCDRRAAVISYVATAILVGTALGIGLGFTNASFKLRLGVSIPIGTAATITLAVGCINSQKSPDMRRKAPPPIQLHL
ncbi:MAG: hypothetical protein H7A36_06340 [Chlamydiales bacterium]|nr:hypothetical protein [Chlamydiales bacterium]